MQDFDWNDLRFLLALQRVGTFAEAARLTGVDETTVSRRLKRLEASLGTTLALKGRSGRYEMTEAATVILNHAERVEQETIAIGERLGLLSGKVAGTVRISSVPFIINRILVPGFKVLERSNPDLTVELVPEPKNVDLTKREADLAVRFSRPAHGGLEVKARKLADMAFDVYCASHLPSSGDGQLPWIGYDDTNRSLPQARWTEALRTAGGQQSAALRVADLDSALEATLRGHGRSILPKAVCNRDNRFRLLPGHQREMSMARSVWLLSHASQANRQAVGAAKAWLGSLPWG